MPAPFPSQSAVGTSPLDQPPPSPTPMGGGPATTQGLAPGGPMPVAAGQMPPEVLTGITQAAQSMSAMLDSFAQVTPESGPLLGLIKDMLQQYLATIATAGSGPVSPTAAGPAFPGGGMDRGVAGPGTV